ncbi:DUF4351 domain-containing protein [Thiobaca trueperi]|uniref:Uncharacterized protein DUF4351 n=1 Tax=Thiobaca trueperi TaxID=127458 RepID=A0A4R3MX40_9GAMM|nr:DUF4351 domain-containing protein [Thiobaca trueperi]TCT20091.1 uncharacterized protein DUF4351 [Thiobaca trueperi]
MSHDQNFKNLILDYPREAIAFFAAAEASALDDAVRILPVRQEQLQERLGERFRELDVPLLVEWPDGRRAALLFVLEEETDPHRFSIHRLAHYCLDLSELLATVRVVPIVIFLRQGRFATELRLGGDTQSYLDFRYLAYPLFQANARDHYDSPNLVARLNLPNMAHAPADRVETYAQAVRGLLTLEPDTERRLKYIDFIDIYAQLDENERLIYQRDYAEEAKTMSAFAERFIQQGVQQGIQQGVQQGEARILLRQIAQRFGAIPDNTRQVIETADAETLLQWSDRILTARTLDEVIH